MSDVNLDLYCGACSKRVQPAELKTRESVECPHCHAFAVAPQVILEVRRANEETTLAEDRYELLASMLREAPEDLLAETVAAFDQGGMPVKHALMVFGAAVLQRAERRRHFDELVKRIQPARVEVAEGILERGRYAHVFWYDDPGERVLVATASHLYAHEGGTLMASYDLETGDRIGP